MIELIMITEQEFITIRKEVQEAVDEVFDRLKNSFPNDYVLFLARGEYEQRHVVNLQNVSPYVIEANEERYKEETRNDFLIEILRQCYSFPQTQQRTEKDEFFQMNIELMIYAHIWESKSFLKQLYRLAHLSNGEKYSWIVTIPDMGKHDFIRDDIRATFYKTSTKMGDVIKKGFHTSLRNAFAHSEFYFETMNNVNRIYLDNYGGKAWELNNITFDDWTKRFLYSALLAYELLHKTSNRRKTIITDFGTNEFTIIMPNSKTEVIVYCVHNDKIGLFNFNNNLSANA